MRQGPILVVEDIPNVLELLEVTLRFKGYEVVSAHNGLEGLEMVEKVRPALIITDILMPELNGLDMLLELTREFLRAKVIAISGTGEGKNVLDVAKLLGARQTFPREVAPDAPAQPRERLTELDHPLELRAVADTSPVRVIPILLAPADIAACRLQVAPGVRADPDVLVGGRNGQARDAREGGGIGDDPPGGRDVRETLALPSPSDSGFRVADIYQAVRVRHRSRLGWFRRDFVGEQCASIFHRRLC